MLKDHGYGYYLVGSPQTTSLTPGKTTIIRRRRTGLPFFRGHWEWSYLYYIEPFDKAWQEKNAPERVSEKWPLFWGNWIRADMIEAGRYESVRPLDAENAAILISTFSPRPPCFLDPEKFKDPSTHEWEDVMSTSCKSVNLAPNGEYVFGYGHSGVSLSVEEKKIVGKRCIHCNALINKIALGVVVPEFRESDFKGLQAEWANRGVVGTPRDLVSVS